MNEWLNMKVDFRHLIDDLLKMYQEEPHEVLVIESIANALDANATEIKISVKDGIYSIEDNGKGMTKKEFENNYHSLAFSTKSRGEGIGFAGVGSKLYLIFLETGNTIKTETRSRSYHGASELVIINGEPKWKYITPSQLNHEGTIYTVQLHNNHKHLLTPDMIREIVQKHYNAILLGLYGDKIITVNDKQVPAMKVNEDKSQISHFTLQSRGRGMKYICQFILSTKELPEENQGLYIIVHGKTIKKEEFVPMINIKPDFQKRITGYVLADGLSELLTTNKADFRPQENIRLFTNFKKHVQENFTKWLKEIGAYQDLDKKFRDSNTKQLIEEVEKFVAEFLNDPSLAKYNPYQAKRISPVAIPDDTGTINIETAEGVQITKGTIGGQSEGGGIEVNGFDQGSTARESSTGTEKGKQVPRTVRHGINIGYKDVPNDLSECWFAPDGIIINTAHPTYKKCQRIGLYGEQLHLLRCVFMALIENNPPNTIKEAFDDLRKVYYKWGISNM